MLIRLIDTKTLATQTSLAERLETSTLEPMVKCLQDNAFGLVNAGKIFLFKLNENIKTFVKYKDVVPGSKGYSLDGGLAHEAGFDAYLTGLCFITMVKCLGKSTYIL